MNAAFTYDAYCDVRMQLGLLREMFMILRGCSYMQGEATLTTNKSFSVTQLVQQLTPIQTSICG